MRAFRAAFVGGFLFGCSGATPPSKPVAGKAEAVSAPDVQQILSAMRERYRSAKTYRDVGTLRGTIRSRGEEPSVTTGRFRTVWSSPGRLGFELHMPARKYAPEETLAIWTPATGGVKELFLGEVIDSATLDEALAAMQGVSDGVTGLVPRWLLDGGCECRVRYELRGTSTCGRSTCFALAGTYERTSVNLFVDTKTFALRRFEERATVTPTHFEPVDAELASRFTPQQLDDFEKRRRELFDSETIIELDPSFDVAIDGKDFEGELTLR